MKILDRFGRKCFFVHVVVWNFDKGDFWVGLRGLEGEAFRSNFVL